MILRRIQFFNYKSITEDTLDIEKDITCLVGINEAGKSNVLLGLEKADTSKELIHGDISRGSSQFRISTATPEIKISLEAYDGEVKELKELFGNDVSKIILYKAGNSYRIDFPSIEFKKSKFYNAPTPLVETAPELVAESANGSSVESTIMQEVASVIGETELADGEKSEIRNKIIDELKQKFIPRFLHFDSVNLERFYLPANGELIISEFIQNPEANAPIKNLLNLGGITEFNQLIATTEDERIARDMLLNEASKKINDEILRVVWPIETVEVHMSSENDLLKLRLREKDHAGIFKPGERSRGLQWSLAFNIYFLAEAKKTITNSILLIDEPGIFLHIDAQKKLLENTFPQINATGNQIIYTTHLPYLIDSKFPERIRILSKNKKNTVETEIGNKSWSEGEFGKIPEPVRTALGMNWSDLFNFSKKNVIVEGPSDQIMLRSITKLFSEGSEIEYLPAYGAKKIPSILSIAKLENKYGFGLYDGDQDINVARQKCATVSIPDKAIDNIPSIVNDKNVLTIEDVIPDEIFAAAIMNVYEPICSRIKNCELTLTEIPTTSPRVSKIEEFFKTKLKRTGHKMLKMEVARAVSDLLRNEKPKKGDTRWAIAQLLVEKLETTLTSNPLKAPKTVPKP